ncbi:MAG TPA: phosphodiester glycosidase family protein [Candidatus Wallbacteria bacterium]|nr:phosphodiester glycosidase family protein [Candidatus Wallbacteria bacterium]
MLFNLISTRSLVTTFLVSALLLSVSDVSEAKLFKIKEKPVESKTTEVSEDEGDTLNTAAEKPKKVAVKTAKAKTASKPKKEVEIAVEKKQSKLPVMTQGTYDEYGIATEEKTFSKKSGDVPVHVIRVDLNQKKVNPKIVLANDKLGSQGTLTEICKNHGAVAGVNGSFFDMKTHAAVGYLMIDGKSIQAPLIVKARTTFGITKDDRVMIGKPKFRRRIRPEGEFFSMIDGINRAWTYGDIIIYTAEYGKKIEAPKGGLCFKFDGAGVVTEVFKGKESIPEEGGILAVSEAHIHRFQNTKAGTKIMFTQTLMSPWDQVKDAFGSGMLLVTDGQITFDQSREEVGQYLMGDAPRTAVGLTANNELVMVVADGRGKGYRGVDFDEIAQIMIDCGCTDAIALDGGGSSTLVYKDEILNTVSEKGGVQRKIANALVLLPAGK